MRDIAVKVSPEIGAIVGGYFAEVCKAVAAFRLAYLVRILGAIGLLSRFDFLSMKGIRASVTLTKDVRIGVALYTTLFRLAVLTDRMPSILVLLGWREFDKRMSALAASTRFCDSMKVHGAYPFVAGPGC